MARCMEISDGLIMTTVQQQLVWWPPPLSRTLWHPQWKICKPYLACFRSIQMNLAREETDHFRHWLELDQVTLTDSPSLMWQRFNDQQKVTGCQAHRQIRTSRLMLRMKNWRSGSHVFLASWSIGRKDGLNLNTTFPISNGALSPMMTAVSVAIKLMVESEHNFPHQ